MPEMRLANRAVLSSPGLRDTWRERIAGELAMRQYFLGVIGAFGYALLALIAIPAAIEWLINRDKAQKSWRWG